MAYVLGDCPSCKGKESFGNVDIHNNQILQGCKYCTYSHRIQLPNIRKKILYLDQFVFSGLYRVSDSRFQEAIAYIKKAIGMQLLIVPYSSVHEDEAYQWRGHDGRTKEDLLEFIRNLSYEYRFRLSEEVQRIQIIKAFKSFLDETHHEYEQEERDVFEEDIHKWDSYIQIGVNQYEPDIELIRNLKTRATEALVDLFDEWHSSSTTFAEDELAELKAAGQNYLSSYSNFVTRIYEGDYNALADAPMCSMVVQTMIIILQEQGSLENNIEKIGKFFDSDYFFHIPYQELSSKIFAKLQDMVKHGAFQNREDSIKRLRGLYYDVEHIATYAPYCDAIVIDNQMAEIVHDPRIALEQTYGVKVFSLNNWNKLFEWIKSLEAEMSNEHKSGLAKAYPDDFSI